MEIHGKHWNNRPYSASPVLTRICFNLLTHFVYTRATQELQLITTSDFAQNVYGGYVSSFEVKVADYYSQVVSIKDDSVVDATVQAGYSCNSRVAYLAGSYIAAIKQGVARFDRLEAYCYPTGFITLALSVVSASINTTVKTVEFRPCETGEVISGNVCRVCEIGFVSVIDGDNLTPTDSCVLCGDGTVTCVGNQMELSSGYWRFSASSLTPLKCPYMGCAGGNLTNEASCKEGYEGPLCSVW